MRRVSLPRAACAAGLTLATLACGAGAASAQAPPPTQATTLASAVVAFLSSATPGTVTVIQRSRAKCTPGECFSVFVTSKANARWALQVKLGMPAVGYTVDLTRPATPSVAVSRLATGTWTTTYVTAGPTASNLSEVTLYGARVTGPSGRVPTAADIASVLQFQLVRVP